VIVLRREGPGGGSPPPLKLTGRALKGRGRACAYRDYRTGGDIRNSPYRLRINPQIRRRRRLCRKADHTKMRAGRAVVAAGTKDSIPKAEALGPTPLEVLLESMLAARRRPARRGRGLRQKRLLPTCIRNLPRRRPQRPSGMKQIIPCCRMRNLSKSRSCFRRRSSNLRPAKRRPRNLA
jgi:hypothetical protein